MSVFLLILSFCSLTVPRPHSYFNIKSLEWRCWCSTLEVNREEDLTSLESLETTRLRRDVEESQSKIAIRSLRKAPSNIYFTLSLIGTTETTTHLIFCDLKWLHAILHTTSMVQVLLGCSFEHEAFRRKSLRRSGVVFKVGLQLEEAPILILQRCTLGKKTTPAGQSGLLSWMTSEEQHLHQNSAHVLRS